MKAFNINFEVLSSSTSRKYPRVRLASVVTECTLIEIEYDFLLAVSLNKVLSKDLPKY